MIVSISASRSKQFDENSSEWRRFSEKIPILPPPTVSQKTAIIYSRVSGQSQPPHASIRNYTSSFQSETVIARGLLNPGISPDFCYRYQMNFEEGMGFDPQPLEVVTDGRFEILNWLQIDSREVYKINSYNNVLEMKDLAATGIRSVVDPFLTHDLADETIKSDNNVQDRENQAASGIRSVDPSRIHNLAVEKIKSNLHPANLILEYIGWKSLLETLVASDVPRN